MADYCPRRASARWMEEAPEYVLSVHDNGGRSFDRYSIFFGAPLWESSMGRKVPGLFLSEIPNSPQGFSIWGEVESHDREASGKKIRWLDLPENVRKHVISRANEDNVL